MYYVYILRSCKTGIHYTGYTSDLDARLVYHNSGNTMSLRKHIPLEIIYTEEYTTKTEATHRERQIKRYKGGEAFRKLISGDV
jgi:putative endonuclease